MGSRGWTWWVSLWPQDQLPQWGLKVTPLTFPVTALPQEMRPSTPGGTIPRWVHAVPVQNRVNTILCCPDLLVRNEATVLLSAGVIGGSWLSASPLFGNSLCQRVLSHPESLPSPQTLPASVTAHDSRKGPGASRQDNRKSQLRSKAPHGISGGFGCGWILVLIPPSAKFYFLYALTDVNHESTPRKTTCMQTYASESFPWETLRLHARTDMVRSP